MMVVMYGIKNCDTIKKAKKYLESKNVEYQFHDFRVDGVNPIQLRNWVAELGWDKIVNKRSTTWRNLPDETKTAMDEVLALAVLEDQPTLIKRPVLETSHGVTVGFSEKQYDALFVS